MKVTRTLAEKPKVLREDIWQEVLANTKGIDDFENSIVGGLAIYVKTLRSGQQGRYQDSVYEAIILAMNPRTHTTESPCPRYLSWKQARFLARNFVHDWVKKSTHPCENRLVAFNRYPLPNGLTLGRFAANEGKPKKGKNWPCWYVRIEAAYND